MYIHYYSLHIFLFTKAPYKCHSIRLVCFHYITHVCTIHHPIDCLGPGSPYFQCPSSENSSSSFLQRPDYVPEIDSWGSSWPQKSCQTSQWKIWSAHAISWHDVALPTRCYGAVGPLHPHLNNGGGENKLKEQERATANAVARMFTPVCPVRKCIVTYL